MLCKETIELFRKYLLTVDRSKETIRGYLVELTCWLRFLEQRHNGPVYLEEITVEDVEAYLLHLKEQGHAPASRSRVVYIIKSFYNFCVKKDLLEKNLGLKLEAVPVPQKERESLTLEEVNELLQAIEHPLLHLVVLTLAYTGLRISECLNLTLKDVDLNTKIMTVRNTKTKKDRRIPIHHDLLPLLKQYVESWREGEKSPYFFATKKTGRLSDVYVNRALHEATRKLGWQKQVTCHILRHTFATNLIRSKVDIVRVQKLLGHSKLATTGIYTHAAIDELAEAVNAL